MTEYLELYIGRRKTSVSVRPDFEWPGIWRVHDGDRVSDMVNLSRAKDAAITWALPRVQTRLRVGALGKRPQRHAAACFL